MASGTTVDRRQTITKHAWTLLKPRFAGFLADEGLTRGAAIAFYTVTSIGRVLFIVVQIAGLVFGEPAPDAVEGEVG